MSTSLRIIDYNARLAPEIDPGIPDQSPNQYTLERVTKAVLPLFALIPSCAYALQIFAGGKGCFNALCEIRTQNQSERIKSLALFTFHAASIGFVWINPLAVSITQSGLSVVQSTAKLGNNILNGDFQKALYNSANIAEKSVFIGAIIMGGPQLLLISMVTQGVYEAYKLNAFAGKKMHLESIVQLIVIITRGYGICKYLENHGHEISNSIVNSKDKITHIEHTKIASVNKNASLNVVARVYQASSTTIQNINGFVFHIADYYTGNRIVTYLNGPMKDTQQVYLDGVLIAQSDIVIDYSDHFEHLHTNGKVYTYVNTQFIEIY